MKTKALSFRLRDQEFQQLQEAAEAAGKPLGEWARETLVDLVNRRAVRPDQPAPDSALVQVVLEEILAFRSIMMSLMFATATGQRPTEADMEGLIRQADKTKPSRAREVIEEAIRRLEQGGVDG